MLQLAQQLRLLNKIVQLLFIFDNAGPQPFDSHHHFTARGGCVLAQVDCTGDTKKE